MPSFRFALLPLLLLASTVHATTPDNVSSRLMIHVSAQWITCFVSLVVRKLPNAYVKSSTDSTDLENERIERFCCVFAIQDLRSK